jgi:hypothetical protein
MYGTDTSMLGKFTLISPASWLIVLGLEPVNGTCTMSIFGSVSV